MKVDKCTDIHRYKQILQWVRLYNRYADLTKQHWNYNSQDKFTKCLSKLEAK